MDMFISHNANSFYSSNYPKILLAVAQTSFLPIFLPDKVKNVPIKRCDTEAVVAKVQPFFSWKEVQERKQEEKSSEVQ